MVRMGSKCTEAMLLVSVMMMICTVDLSRGASPSKKEKICNKGWECKASVHCCNETISDLFRVENFEELFTKRNTPVAHAVGFWDYRSFITASAQFQPVGFGTTGGKQMQMKEVAAFLGHVGSKTSCK